MQDWILSIDHFIPRGLVLHNEMRNSVHTFKNINRMKSNNLLEYYFYIDKFCVIWDETFCFGVDENRNNQIDIIGRF
jgi:hypothetical protein